MWILTPFGFFSVVQKKEDHMLSVRSRVYADLQHLIQAYLPDVQNIEEGGYSDYPYRIFVSHAAWGQALGQIARDIDYPNFKRTVKQRQGSDRSAVYRRVWQELYTLQEECDDRKSRC
ncbi:MAG: hypothetical protein VX278_14250 [Myxococcota bacterium]|nr:hypothetical protein [Myxococcota bacterium]